MSAVVMACGSTLAGLRWGVPYLHSWGILPPLPHSLGTVLVLAVIAYAAIFLVAELALLIAAALTVRKPEVHRRFINLMLWWAYAPVMPYMLIKSRKLPQQLLPREPSRSAEQRAASVKARPAHRRQVVADDRRRGRSGADSRHRSPQPQPGAGARPGDVAPPVTPDEYRKALQLLIRHVKDLQGDCELLNVCLLYLSMANDHHEAEGADAPASRRRRIGDR
jgi:hypothetical protein